MSFHDKLVQNALSMGQSSTHFTKVAQEKANATWFYGLIAGALWYFQDWMWAILPIVLAIYSVIQSISSTKVAMGLENLQGEKNNYLFIIHAYGAILEETQIGLGVVADVKELPFSKKQIKDAIILALQNSNDSKINNDLINGYIALADWQENVGETHQGFNSLQYDKVPSPETVLDQMKISDHWYPLVEKEQVALKSELKELNLLPQ